MRGNFWRGWLAGVEMVKQEDYFYKRNEASIELFSKGNAVKSESLGWNMVE